jgi:hypothetical protein
LPSYPFEVAGEQQRLASALGHVPGADPLMDALPGEAHPRRVEGDQLATILDRLLRVKRVPEHEALRDWDGDHEVRYGRLDGFPAHAEAVVDLDPLLRQRAQHSLVSLPGEDLVDAVAEAFAPQVARHPEQLPLPGIGDDDVVGLGSPLATVHDRQDGGHRRPPASAPAGDGVRRARERMIPAA